MKKKMGGQMEGQTKAFNLRLPVAVSDRLRMECRKLGMTKQGYIQCLIESKLKAAK